MANKHTTLTSLFDDIADAIRSTSSITGEIPADAFPAYILAKGRSDCPATPGVLNSCPWSFIKWASDEGLADLFWSVGDRKAVTLSDWGNPNATYAVHGGTFYCYILGFNHNAEKEGNNRIHFEFGFDALSGGNHIAFSGADYNLIYTKGTEPYFNRMNIAATNAGGWESSLMRTGTLNGSSRSFRSACPSDLLNVLKTVTKYTDNVGGGKGNIAASVSATTDTFFLLAESEWRNGTHWSNSHEASHTKRYSYYANGNSMVHKMTHNGQAGYVCCRSPKKDTADRFVGKGAAEGYIGALAANQVYSIAPCFCV